MFLQLSCSCSFYIILFAYGIHFHGNIISVRGAIMSHKTNLARPHFTEVAAPAQASVWLCAFVLWISVYTT